MKIITHKTAQYVMSDLYKIQKTIQRNTDADSFINIADWLADLSRKVLTDDEYNVLMTELYESKEGDTYGTK